MNGIVSGYAGAARAVHAAVAAVPGDAWEQPGLGEWTVRDLVGHASRSLVTVLEYLVRPVEHEALASAADFTLHTPSSRSELGDYAPRVKSVHRYFCKTCGAHVWMEGEYPIGEGKVMPVCAVNLGTVDVPVEGVDLRRTEMGYFDMLHDNVAGGVAETPWEGGLI